MAGAVVDHVCQGLMLLVAFWAAGVSYGFTCPQNGFG